MTEAVRMSPALPRSGISFRHPLVLAVAVGVTVNLLGVAALLAAWFRLDQVVLGDGDPPERPTLRIVTGYPGASPEVVEQVITLPLETQLDGAEGVESVRCVAWEGTSEIFLRLSSARDLDATLRSVQGRINLALPMLPVDSGVPTLDRTDPDALPLAWFVVKAEHRPRSELSALARERVRDGLITVPGVGDVTVVGADSGALNVRVDPDRLRAFNVTLQDVTAALRPGGQAGEKARDLMRLIVAERAGRVIRLDDVARLEAGDRPHETARCDGNAAVALGVCKAFRSDAAALRRTLRERLPALRSTLPEDVDLTVLEGPVSSGASDWLLLDVEPPAGIRREALPEVLVELEKRLAAVPERSSVLTYLGPADATTRPSAHCLLQLLPTRGRSIERIQADVRRAVEDLPAARVTVHQVVARRGVPARKRTFEVLVEAEGLDEVARLTPRLRDALADGAYVTEAQSDEVELQPQPVLIPKREQARERGVDLRTCFEVSSAVRGGCVVGEWEADGRKQRINVILGDGAGQGGEVLRGLFVRGVNGRDVALADVFEVRHVVAMAALYRHDGKRGARITGNVASGRSPTEVFSKCRELAAELGLPAGGRVRPGGDFLPGVADRKRQ